MQGETFAELMEAAGQALSYERGAREGYRVVQAESLMSRPKTLAKETVSPESKPKFQRKHKNAPHR